MTTQIPSETDMRAYGATLLAKLRPGDVVLLYGDLGAGKTTLVRGVLEALKFEKSVRSPTFNLLQTFPTDPPILHADLYRVGGTAGLGLEDYLDTHISFIEWPDRAGDLLRPEACWRLTIDFIPEGRRVTLVPPEGFSE